MDEQQSKAPGGAPASDMLGALLSNPDLLRRVSSILTGAASPGATDPAQNTAQPQAEPAAQPTVQSAPVNASPPVDGLAAVLGDPALMEKLPSMIAVLKPLMNTIPTPKASNSSSPAECRDQLLLSLKPFLSSERRDAVDQILRLAKLGAVFKQLR